MFLYRVFKERGLWDLHVHTVNYLQRAYILTEEQQGELVNPRVEVGVTQLPGSQDEGGNTEVPGVLSGWNA